MKTLAAKLYSQMGTEAGSITLPDALFARKINPTLLSETVISMQKNLKVPTSHAKDRGEVRGGGRKPWRQKGTGRARHGSIRSPIWRGGGVTHGPQKGRTHTRKINKKVKDASLAMALTGKFGDSQVFFIDAFLFEKPRTKDMEAVLGAVIGKSYGKGSVLIVQEKADEKLEMSMRNLKSVTVQRAQSLSTYDVLAHKYLILTKGALEVLTKRLS